MAYMNSDSLMNDGKNYLKNHSQCWNNLNVVTPPQPIRILLFKECRLKDRQLIFDSHINQNTTNENGLSQSEKRNSEEFSSLTEMIFGSTAMKYHDTYYKIHDVASPEQLIFTQVFSTPNVKGIPSNTSFAENNSQRQFSSTFFNSDSSASSLSFDSRTDSFSIFRKNNWSSPNSTFTTIDSGFSESNFSSNSSLQPSYGSFTRRTQLQSSNASFKNYNSFLNELEFSKHLSQTFSYSRLGLALIVSFTSSRNELNHRYMEHINFIESILWRIRHYVELALKSPKLFFDKMLEISNFSAKWLSNEFILWTRKETTKETSNVSSTNLLNTFRKTLYLFKLGKKDKEENEQFKKFCKSLEKLDVKETKFFLSTLLTAVLTHQTGWISTCMYINDISINDSYNSIWKQLLNLHGATGYLTKTSRIVIYGLKNDDIIKYTIDFLSYFIRYVRVQKKLVERDGILEENEAVNDICDNIYKIDCAQQPNNRGLTKSKRISVDLSQISYSNEYTSEHKTNTRQRGLIKTETLNDFSKFDYEDDSNQNEDNLNKSVLFILGDNDKLEDLHKTRQYYSETANSYKMVNSERHVKLKIIKFPLPRIKSCSDVSEILPYDFLANYNFFKEYEPDKIIQGINVPENNWKKNVKNHLSLKSSCLFQNEIEENLVIIGDTNKWDVEICSNVRNRMAKNGTVSAADSSLLVSKLLEVLLEMWKENNSKEQCATFIEQRLVEICLKANTLSQFLQTKDFCAIETLIKTLHLNIVDVPFLMSVASYINPDILKKYGISYQ